MNKQYFYMKVKQPQGYVQTLTETTGQQVKIDPRNEYVEVKVGEYSAGMQYPNYFRLVATKRELEDLQERFAEFYMSKVLNDVRQAPHIIDLDTAYTLAVNAFYRDCLGPDDQKIIDSLMTANEAKDLRE